MKVSYFYPKQSEAQKDTLFCKRSKHEFMNQRCDASVDFVYAASVSVLETALKSAEQFKIPIVCWCWDIPYNWKNGWGLPEAGRIANKGRSEKVRKYITMLSQCDHIISASKYTQDVLKQHFNLPSEQLYFYITTDQLDAVPQPEKKAQIIQISRYFWNKKFEHSIQACADIWPHKLVTVGNSLNNSYGKMLVKAADSFGNDVLFFENIKRQQVIKELKASEILVSPSVFEGWGITPIEALYCGVPVLLSDLPVFKEVYGDAVLYHRLHNPLDMEHKLKLLIKNKDKQKEIVERCQPIIADFIPERFAKRWDDLIYSFFGG